MTIDTGEKELFTAECTESTEKKRDKAQIYIP